MKYIPYLGEVLQILRPNSTYSIDDFGDRQEITYAENNSQPLPSESELLAKSNEIVGLNNWKNLRSQRNRLIANTDYLALSDVTLTDDMKTYRQALRDLPANTTDPANPVWPTKPGA